MANASEVEALECRICQSSGAIGLTQPCLCKGSVGSVHVKCLEQWLTASGGDRCELCSYQFRTIRVRRFSLLRSIVIWVPTNCSALARGIGGLVVLCLWLVSLMYTTLIVVACAFNLARIVRGDDVKYDQGGFFEHDGRTPSPPAEETTDDGEWSKEAQRWSEGLVCLILMVWYLFVSLVFAMCLKVGCKYTCAYFKRKYDEWHRWWNESSEVRLVFDSRPPAKRDDEDVVEIDLGEGVAKSGDLPEAIRVVQIKPEDPNDARAAQDHCV